MQSIRRTVSVMGSALVLAMPVAYGAEKAYGPTLKPVWPQGQAALMAKPTVAPATTFPMSSPPAPTASHPIAVPVVIPASIPAAAVPIAVNSSPVAPSNPAIKQMGMADSPLPKKEATPNRQPAPRDLTSPLPPITARPDGQNALPIDWPAVLRLAHGSNLDISMATEKVHESQIELSLARLQWLPSLRLGTSWLHHEGRIQDIPGNIIDTSKSSLFGGAVASATWDPSKVAVDVLKAKQQQFARNGELDRASRQALLDASQSYNDLVAAQAGASIAEEIAQLIGDLVKRSEEFLKQGQGTQVDVLRHQANYKSQLQHLNTARKNQLAASAKLVQLLNLDASVRLYAADEHLGPVTLIDENRPEEELIMVAQQQGPGIGELVQLLAALEEQQQSMRRISLMPTVSLDFGQGAFGGGFGGTYADVDSRTDMGAHVYWDVLKVFGNSQTKELFESKKRQTSIAQEQVLKKLAIGVVVARSSAIQARQRIELAEKEIELAIKAYQLSQARLQALETLPMEVLQAIGTLGQARANYLAAVVEYNRSQIQLQYLIGHCDSSGQTPENVGFRMIAPTRKHHLVH